MAVGNRGGRPPKPTALKLIQGTARKDRVSANEPKPEKPARVPPPPKGLGKIGQAEWRRTAKHLHGLNLLTVVDTEMLFQYCKAVELERQATGYLAKWNLDHPDHPNLIKINAVTGISYRTHPWVLQRDTARKAVLDFAKEFGMSPSSRTRVEGMVQAPKANKFDQYK
jgi:P27 family predicted phage terminase small subunit